MKRIFVCGIGTDVGKTIVSAILVKALKADYWKPVQGGNLEESDSKRVKKMVPEAVCHPEAYRLHHPISPHHSAALEGIELKSERFHVPKTDKPLVIEATGGLLVPYRTDQLLIDEYLKWNCEWIVVSRHYVGSINHTLMTLEVLRHRGVKLRGIIFNGTDQPYTEAAILACTDSPCIGHLYPEEELSPHIIQRYADKWSL